MLDLDVPPEVVEEGEAGGAEAGGRQTATGKVPTANASHWREACTARLWTIATAQP